MKNNRKVAILKKARQAQYLHGFFFYLTSKHPEDFVCSGDVEDFMSRIGYTNRQYILFDECQLSTDVDFPHHQRFCGRMVLGPEVLVTLLKTGRRFTIK